MYEISAFGHFDAAHFLREYKGKCANVHGHRWKVEITLRGKKLDELGILIDFVDVKAMLKEVLDIFDHKMINEVPPFDKLNPTAENLSRFIYDEMAEKLNNRIGSNIQIGRVTIWETETASASYFKD